MLTERNKLTISGALACAMSLVIGVNLGGSDKPTRDATHEAIGSAIAAGSAVGSATADLNTGGYNDAIIEARNACPTCIDLLTALVEPGAEVTTGVSLPLGKRTTGALEFFGPAAGSFEKISVTHTDRDTVTWVEIKARNKSLKAARLNAWVHIAP